MVSVDPSSSRAIPFDAVQSRPPAGRPLAQVRNGRWPRLRRKPAKCASPTMPKRSVHLVIYATSDCDPDHGRPVPRRLLPWAEGDGRKATRSRGVRRPMPLWDQSGQACWLAVAGVRARARRRRRPTQRAPMPPCARARRRGDNRGRAARRSPAPGPGCGTQCGPLPGPPAAPGVRRRACAARPARAPQSVGRTAGRPVAMSAGRSHGLSRSSGARHERAAHGAATLRVRPACAANTHARCTWEPPARYAGAEDETRAQRTFGVLTACARRPCSDAIPV